MVREQYWNLVFKIPGETKIKAHITILEPRLSAFSAITFKLKTSEFQKYTSNLCFLFAYRKCYLNPFTLFQLVNFNKLA